MNAPIDAAALRAGKAAALYADAILFSVDEPKEGGRLATAALLLATAAEHLGPRDDALWVELCAQTSVAPETWTALFTRTTLTADGVRDARRVVWAALSRFEAPELATQRRLIARRAAMLFAGVLLLVVGTSTVRAVQRHFESPSLLLGKPFRTSSHISHDPGNAKLLFHTDKDASPWVEYDLQGPLTLREVVIFNRSDCCNEAVLPLVVEVSDDQQHWTKVAEQKATFSSPLSLPFPPVQANYLRLRVERTSYLHLEGVEAR